MVRQKVRPSAGALVVGALLLLSCGPVMAQQLEEPTIHEAHKFFMAEMSRNTRITIFDNHWIPDDFLLTKIEFKNTYPCIFASAMKAPPHFNVSFGFKFSEIEKIQTYTGGDDLTPFSSSIFLTGNILYGFEKNMRISHSVLLRFSTKGIKDRSLRALLFMQQKCAAQKPF